MDTSTQQTVIVLSNLYRALVASQIERISVDELRTVIETIDGRPVDGTSDGR